MKKSQKLHEQVSLNNTNNKIIKKSIDKLGNNRHLKKRSEQFNNEKQKTDLQQLPIQLEKQLSLNRNNDKKISDDDETEQVFLLEDSNKQFIKKLDNNDLMQINQDLQFKSASKVENNNYIKPPTQKNYLLKNILNIQQQQSEYKKQHLQNQVGEKPTIKKSRKYEHIQSKIGQNEMYSSCSQWGHDNKSKGSESYYLRIIDQSIISQISKNEENKNKAKQQSEKEFLNDLSINEEIDFPNKLQKSRTTPQKDDDFKVPQSPIHIQKFFSDSPTQQYQEINQISERISKKAINIIGENELQIGEKILGKGGFGVVKEGVWGHIEVAVKEVEIDNEHWSKIESELIFLSTYRHPRIISLFGVYLKPTRQGLGLGCSLVMELMDADLDHLIWKQPPLSIIDKLIILQQITEALCFLHQKNLVHRDLKPKNVLVKRENDRLQVKISDLGLSKLADQSGESNTLAFTPRYTSREQADGLVVTSGDIWSVGLICYELMSGKRPWEGMSQIQIITQLLKGVCPLHAGWGDQQPIPQPFKDLVAQCLNYQHTQRPSALQIHFQITSIIGTVS